jgi:hypothetical protein
MNVWIQALWLLCYMLIVPNLLFAQSTEEKAKSLAKEAFQAFQAQDFDTALVKYEQALDLLPNPTIMVNLATVYEHLKQDAKAFQICKEALNSKLITPTVQKVANDCVSRIEPRLNEIQATIDSRPSRAQLKIDGEDMGKTPWEGILKPGRRQIDIELPQYVPVSKVISPIAGSKVDLKIPLFPLGLGALMNIRTNPEGANVLIDGAFIGQSPIQSHQIPAGAHQLEIFLQGYIREIRTISLAEGDNYQEKFYLQLERGKLSAKDLWPAWGLMSAGVLTTGLASFFGYQALDARNEADRIARTDGTQAGLLNYDRQINKMDFNQNAADILWVSTGILLTSGLVWWLVN